MTDDFGAVTRWHWDPEARSYVHEDVLKARQQAKSFATAAKVEAAQDFFEASGSGTWAKVDFWDEPEPTPGTEAGAVLREAADLVDGPREAEHGDKRASFDGIAHMWQAYLDCRGAGPLTGYDVAQLMVLLKMTRPLYGQRMRDHGLDQCGYSGIATMLGRGQ